MIKIKGSAVDKLYFSSDLHLKHTNIIEYANRPFGSIEEMENTIITNWNNTVPPDGEVYIEGDFIFTGNLKIIEEYLQKLNGVKHLILGNHDYKNKLDRASARKLFASVNDLLYLNIYDPEMDSGQQGLFLSHYPLLSWFGSNQGSWNLFGHIHSGPYSTFSDKGLPLKPTQYDVGVDNNNFTPCSYAYIKTQITRNTSDVSITMNHFQKLVTAQIKAYPNIRLGQIYFNVFHSLFPDIANSIRNTEFDPYYNYDQTSLQKFLDYIHKYLKDDNI